MGKKLKPMDGLGPREKAKIRNALRSVWRYSLAHRLVVARCRIGKTEYARCEGCKKKCPRVYVDHVTRCGDVDGGFIERLMVPSKYLQGLCKTCHDGKTKSERGVATHGF